MCGIVGYIGERDAQGILTSGLRRLEYRGYDSAGIVTIDSSGQTTLLREKGKVSELDKLVLSHENHDKVGIGHTRWATHGEPSEINAHPHQAGDIYLVHNGIIENYKELKAELKDHNFVSETDSEVLAAMIDSLYDKDTSLVDAVTQALKLVIGTYGIAVISSREPEIVVVARSGSPLIIGVNDNETLIASDACALIGHTDKAIYLNDNEVAICKKDGVDLRDMSAQPISSKVETIEIDMQAIQKQGYDHFLLKEISEQPQTLRATLSGRINERAKDVRLDGLNLSTKELKSIEHITIIGCGTAYYAGLLSSYYLEQLVDGLTIDVAAASELRYRSFHLPKNTIALVVSQSGETADTLACLREIKRRDVKTIGIINTVGSTIAREVDGGIYVHAGPEISVASTKAFTSQVAAITMLGIQIAQAKGVGIKETSKYIDELAKLPDEIDNVIKNYKEKIAEIAKKYAKYEHSLYFGRDTLFPVALEGALKLKEISYTQAEGYAAGELKHGPIALVDDNFFEVALLLDNWLFDKGLSALSEVNARGGHVFVITNSTKDIDAEEILRIDTKLDILAPIVINVVQQLFAYYVAVARGNDVDQPRNLAKSVTVE
ncbi:glutamine--fructose-6-phosphate transaminase (isomerizing) [Candidatus Saccharibacteria bacterium HGW-Saccharibacteria-1]|jgi:glucosamine--fructose-6-phosphate aminotransferase (isomerizing)|nr:MAG: glutamine--fructose-6-phosphate transaminase (isomerizing) [Candidatus Saccharibacteria bacterium HGW-Saccharibacteria-1]